MSRLNLSPNYCSCTVNRARNLLDKGKNGGINAFCKISLGKEKFVTAVQEKTTSPDWHTQCDMPISDGDTPIKLTVYNNNKSSLSDGDFIGRALISLRDLPDYDRIHTNWYKLANKDGKLDKDRGEIEVSLRFYSQNNATGSVLDLTTKKKHGSLRDIKQSLKDKLKSATKHHHKHDKNGGDNVLSEHGHHDGSSHGRDFIDDSPSESASFTGSHISLNSTSYNNNNSDQHKKKSRAPNNGTPRSSRHSITSDYETSSILDSASMYGGDELSTSSPSVPNQAPQQREINIDEYIKTKTKAPAPIISITKPSDSNLSTKRKESEIISKVDSVFGLSTIKESHDTDENHANNSRQHTDDELEFGNYFKQSNQQKKTKKQAPILPQPKEESRLSTFSQSDDIKTPSTSISIKSNPLLTSSTLSKQSENLHDSTDDDVDELLGNLERMSSMRSSVKRRIQPRNDIMQESFSEPDNKNLTPLNRNRKPTLPDIIDDPRGRNSPQSSTKGLPILGYADVKATPINPKVRQELEYIDREDLLHIIAHQSDIIKKRDTRVKDLEQYTDRLLCKIVEQCPSILQVGSSTKR